MKDITSARLLLKAVRDLEASLLKSYEVHPVNPATDFLNAAASVAFLSKIVFKELVKRQGSEISASWALSTAIALGEFEAAAHFLEVEINDMKGENQDLRQLRDSMETAILNHGRSEQWYQLLMRLDKAV